MEPHAAVTDSPRIHSSTTYFNSDDGKTYAEEWVVCAGDPPVSVPKIYAYADRLDGEVDECNWHPENKPPAVMARVVYPLPDRKSFH